MARYLKTIILSAFTLLLLVAPTVGAQGIKDTSILKQAASKAGTTETKIEVVVGQAIGAVLTLVGLFFLVLMVYAGILWMTARGEEEQIKKSQRIIVAAVIGFFITVAAYAITNFVVGRFEG